MKTHFLFLSIAFVLTIISCEENKFTIPDGFEIMDGYTLELVAAEPLIADPVDLEFDENGNAYVLEMPGYPFEDKHSRIVKLLDENQDGIFDSNIVFAESLQLASSILPFKKGILVAGPPYLLYIYDTNGDGKADTRDTLMGGFSTGNLQHNYNGLTYGLDNWIYAANGGNSGSPYWWGDTSTTLDLRGDDIRINLESKTFERIGYSSGGFELAVDDYGRIFETHNLEHISHSVFSGRYVQDAELIERHTLENVSDHEEGGLARIYPIGEQESRVNHPEQSGYFSGACGITHYGGGQMGMLNGSIWIADVVLNLIHLDQISALGSSFSAKRVGDKRDFLASSDRSFRPVNMTVGPNGEMYVIDMYREVIEHPEWIPDDIEKTLDLEAGKDKGRIYKVTKTNSGNDISYDFSNSEGLVTALGNSNQWVRNTAQRLILEGPMNPDILNLLKEKKTISNNFQRLHSLWILHHKNQLTESELLNGLEDKISGNRENALIVSEAYMPESQTVINKVIKLLNDNNQRVRMQAALSLSTLSDSEKLNIQAQVLEKLKLTTTFSVDKWNSAAITLLVSPFAEKAFEVVEENDDFENKNELLKSFILASSKNTQRLTELIVYISNSEMNSDEKTELINIMSPEIGKSAQLKSLGGSLSELEKSAEVPLLSALTGLRKKLGLTLSDQYVIKSQDALGQLANQNLEIKERLDLLELIRHLPFENRKELLYSLCDNTQPVQLQLQSLEQLWQADDPNIGETLVRLWRSMGPQARGHASDILLYKESHHDALLTGLEDGTINIGEMNFDLERRRTLLWWTDNENTKERAQNLFTDSGVINRKEAMDKMKGSLSMNGSVEDGEMVFNQLCAQCHVYNGKGADVGPVLTEINRKSKESLLHDILDPNAAVDTKYINHKIETEDGRLLFGMVDVETDQSILLKNSNATTQEVKKSEIKSFESLGTSLMMEGLEGSMTEQDMADLLTFLQQSI